MFLLIGSSSYAQKAITLAADPLTTVLLGGVEVETGINFNKNRITVGYLNGDLPPWFSQSEDFNSANHSTIEISYSRFLKEEQKGFNFGLAYAYFTEFWVQNEIGQTLEKNPSRIGLKIAYAWFPFEKTNLYLEPSMTFGTLIGDEDLNYLSGELFEKKTFIGNGPLFNVGYKFNL